MNCSKCGRSNPDDARFCSQCGAPLGEPFEVQETIQNAHDQNRRPDLVYPKNPPLNPHLCWVNLVVSGLAQILHGQVAKGILLLVLTMASNMMFPIVLAIVIGALSVADAFMVGKSLQRGIPVEKWAWFPKS